MVRVCKAESSTAPGRRPAQTGKAQPALKLPQGSDCAYASSLFSAIDPKGPICPISVAAGVKAKLAAHATTTVIALPRNAYQVHAVCVRRNTYSIETKLTSIPIKAAGWLTRFNCAPTRNTPRIGPLISDAIDSAMLNADPG